MAIYHLSVKTISRGSGGSAAAKHDYIKRRARYKADIDEVLFAVDGNMPSWAIEAPVKYWRGADRFERKNGRLFKLIEFALPVELSLPARQTVAKALTTAVTTTPDGPLPYSMAIHAGHGRGNPHVHLIVSERVQDGEERTAREWFGRAGDRRAGKPGARKTSALKAKGWLMWLRQTWEDIANTALEAEGHAERIDCRTLKAQGIDREPGRHLGPARAAMERKNQALEEERAAQAQQVADDAIDEELNFLDDFENNDLEAKGSEPGADPGNEIGLQE